MIFSEISLTNENDALLYAFSYEEPKVHISFEDSNGHVLVAEWISGNYSAFEMYTVHSVETYVRMICDVEWIMENMIKCKEKVRELLFNHDYMNKELKEG